MGDYFNPRRLGELALAFDAVAVLGWLASAQGWVESLDLIFAMLALAPLAVIVGSAAWLRRGGERSDRTRALVAVGIGLAMSGVGAYLLIWRG